MGITGAEELPRHGHNIRDDAYLRLLLALLLTASFFEGYDGGILDIVTPAIQDAFGLSETGIGLMRGIIRIGAVFAFFVALSADYVGRRVILLWSVVGYTIATAATAFAPNVVLFTLFQMIAQIFLGSEYAVAVTMISEEFPPERRGRALGIFTLATAAGVILVPVLALAGIMKTALDWRALFLVGIAPLVATAFFRRRIKETALFEQRKAEQVRTGEKGPAWNAAWKQPYRYYMVTLACVTFFRAFPVYAGTAWWVWYAEREAGLEPTLVQIFLIFAYGLGIAGYYICGRSIDRFGRKPVAITFAIFAWIFATLMFNTRAPLPEALFVMLAVFFGLGITPALNAYYTELFPTRIRASAAAWARNVFEIPAVLLGPLIAGYFGDHGSGAIGSIGSTVTIMLGVLPAAAYVIWRYLPETRGRDLEMMDAEVL